MQNQMALDIQGEVVSVSSVREAMELVAEFLVEGHAVLRRGRDVLKLGWQGDEPAILERRRLDMFTSV